MTDPVDPASGPQPAAPQPEGPQPGGHQPMPVPQPVPPPPPYGAGYGAVPVDNNLGWAIGSLLVCWPFGIPSLIKSLQVQSLWAQGLHQQAQHSAAEAKKWGKIGVIVGASLMGLYVVGMIAYFVFIFAMIGAAGASGF